MTTHFVTGMRMDGVNVPLLRNVMIKTLEHILVDSPLEREIPLAGSFAGNLSKELIAHVFDVDGKVLACLEVKVNGVTVYSGTTLKSAIRIYNQGQNAL